MSRVILLFLLSAVVVVAACWFYFYQNSKNIAPNTESPYEVLNAFWAGAVQGDEKLVAGLVALPPRDLLSPCHLSNNAETELEVQSSELVISQDNAEIISAVDGNRRERFDSNPFFKLTNNKSMSDFAMFLKNTKTPFEDVRILKKREYDNEMLIEISIKDAKKLESNDYRYFVFLTKEIDDWKLVSVLTQGFINLFPSNSFATPRPQCN